MTQRAIAYFPLSGGASEPPDRDHGQRIARFVRDRGWVLIEPFVEFEGRERPQLKRALARCLDLDAVLVLPSLAAAARDRGLLDFVLDARVRVAAPDRPRVGRATLKLLRDIAEDRRARISARRRSVWSQ